MDPRAFHLAKKLRSPGPRTGGGGAPLILTLLWAWDRREAVGIYGCEAVVARVSSNSSTACPSFDHEKSPVI